MSHLHETPQVRKTAERTRLNRQWGSAFWLGHPIDGCERHRLPQRLYQ